MKLKIKTAIWVLLLGISLVQPVYAIDSIAVCGGNEATYADPVKLNQPGGLDAYNKNSCKLVDIFYLVIKVTNFLIGFAGIFAVAMIVFRGFQMVISQGNSEAVSNAKSGLTNAIIGLIIVLLSYLVVAIIFSIFQIKLGLPPGTSKIHFPGITQ